MAVRVLYTALAAYAPTGIPGVSPDGSKSLRAFNTSTGSFAVYLAMSVIMEMIVVLIYVTIGLRTPLESDYGRGKMITSDEQESMNGHVGSDAVHAY